MSTRMRRSWMSGACAAALVAGFGGAAAASTIVVNPTQIVAVGPVGDFSAGHDRGRFDEATS